MPLFWDTECIFKEVLFTKITDTMRNFPCKWNMDYICHYNFLLSLLLLYEISSFQVLIYRELIVWCWRSSVTFYKVVRIYLSARNQPLSICLKVPMAFDSSLVTLNFLWALMGLRKILVSYLGGLECNNKLMDSEKCSHSQILSTHEVSFKKILFIIITVQFYISI